VAIKNNKSAPTATCRCGGVEALRFRGFHTLNPNSNYCLTLPWLTLPVEHVDAFDGSAQLEGWQLYAAIHLAAAL
jgi:hypothetical protein